MISLQRRRVSVGEQYMSFSREVMTSATVYPLVVVTAAVVVVVVVVVVVGDICCHYNGD